MLHAADRRRTDTRERILELAEASTLAKGFGGTSIDELIAGVGITKSGFFYHFRDKTELAEALMDRYLVHNRKVISDIFDRADELIEDPLHGMLAALKMFAETLSNIPEAHPGCLAATFCYQDQLFSARIREMNIEGMLDWRTSFRRRFEAIVERYPPKREVDLDAMADSVITLVEGGLILGRVHQDPSILPRQIMLFRDFVRLSFS
ncbi:TetR/AcrR family transcriptional regulator [Hansschlegelia zhihuaiae]|uniref:TetR/AcrR family transcriptional regulator n=1 Tax=Hansschlegelia zhihuaiae TaxID=405005 RepID=A0A4V1KJQ4_9HYPH|nr:TetR/AcrR family transcriptional regulator [Hansschlegelia zhihuaiae]RXF75002.1 TetR/AcrR family transcriptional regulator [Hansschlegelia zhihuaiae]